MDKQHVNGTTCECNFVCFHIAEVEIIDADEAPSFPHGLPEHVSPHENDEHVVIMCQVRGEPIPKIMW